MTLLLALTLAPQDAAPRQKASGLLYTPPDGGTQASILLSTWAFHEE